MKAHWIFPILISLSCISLARPQKLMVEGQIVIHHPYCGGAEPTKEMERGVDENYANATFYVKSKINNSKTRRTVAKITTDEEGKFKLALKKPGTYFLMQESKTLSLEEFIKKNNTSGRFLSYVGDQKAAEIYKTPDLQFTVTEAGTIKMVLNARCFSGINPLLEYTGPMPQ